MIKDSYELWQKIIKVSKLDLKYYDKEIETSLIRELNINSTDLQKTLKNNKIRIEDFIIAFFTVVQPFSKMMSEILEFFENNAIKSTNDNLEIELDFGNDFSKLNFDINAFKNYLLRWKEIEAIVFVKQWNLNNLWKLNKILRTSSLEEKHIELYDWESIYEGELRWPNFYPPFPSETPTELKIEFEHAYEVFRIVHEKSKAFNPNRQDLWEMGWNQRKENNDSESSWNLELLGGIDHDRWAMSFINGLYSRAKEYYLIDKDKQKDFVKSLKDEMNAIYSSLNEVKQKILNKIEDIFEFLDLPIWKQRHELYSVWVGIKTLKILQTKFTLRVHSVENKLVFSFSGTHLATIDNLLPNIHIWSELRSPLSNPIGKFRKKAIQPDYSLMKDPINNSKSSILEIECKQYKKASKANFTSAVIDYANGRPNAHIILVNYSSINPGILNDIPNNLALRTTMIGNLNPNFQIQINLFETLILDTINYHYPNAAKDQFTDSFSSFDNIFDTIEMNWDKGAKDLDLYVQFKNAEEDFKIYYRNKGDINNYPFIHFVEDIRTGDGSEVVKCTKWLKGKYYISVHNYSRNPQLKESNVKIKFARKEYHIEDANGDVGDWWHVLEIDTINNKMYLINEINSEEYYGK